MEIFEIEIGLLKAYEKNARIHSEDQIKDLMTSIIKFGFNDPIEVDDTYTILSGHGRYEAAKNLGMEKIPVLKHSHLSDKDKKAYILAANRISQSASWDYDLLKFEFRDLMESGFDLLQTGFKSLEIDTVLILEDVKDVDEDDIPENVEPRCKKNDIYQLGKHFLGCGDIKDIDHIFRLMGESKADLILSDPPYNVAYEGNKLKRKKIKNDEMPVKDFEDFLTASFLTYDTVSKDNATFYVFHASSYQNQFQISLENNNFEILQQLIWAKNHFTFTRAKYKHKHEPVFFGHKKSVPINFYGDKKQSSIWHIDKPSRSKLHPTMKPIALLEIPIKNSSKHGDIIIDFFGGSGSTLIASEKLGRICYMNELEPEYCDVIIKRWENYTNREAVKIYDNNN